MTYRGRMQAVLNYQDYDRLPVVHFGFWTETLAKWKDEGHLADEDLAGAWDGGPTEHLVNKKLGFDSNYHIVGGGSCGLDPHFERQVLETLPDGSRKVRDYNGVVVLESDDAGSIPSEIEHLLVDRKSWEEHYLPRLQFFPERVKADPLRKQREVHKDNFFGLHCGSLFGELRNWIGVLGVAYIGMDDEELFTEMIDTVGNLSYQVAEAALATGVEFDFAHFWEDICFKNGPLVQPDVFDRKCGPHYQRITKLLAEHGINIVSLDCDGLIDSLIPTWIENGVNTMFPIEVGTWDANIKPWREKYGRELRGVGGMNKTVFARDRKAVDAEIDRLKPLVDLGGYVPCPDHRIPPDAEWDNVRYYCEQMRRIFA